MTEEDNTTLFNTSDRKENEEWTVDAEEERFIDELIGESVHTLHIIPNQMNPIDDSRV